MLNRELLKKALLGCMITDDLKKKYLDNNLTLEETQKILSTQIPPNRYYGQDWPKDAETMVGYLCLNNIELLIDDVVQNNIEGDFIETGVWKGGVCIYVKKLFDDYKLNKKIFVADSFEGLPPPEMERYPQDAGDNHHKCLELQISMEEVAGYFKNYNCLDENVKFLKGWFKDTLPKINKKQKFCIIRLDGDMYSSTMDALENLYPKLSKGGYVIIDDYALKNCALAVDDYRKRFNITTPFTKIIGAGAGALFWKKND